MRAVLVALLVLACGGQSSTDAAVDAPMAIDAPMSDGQCGGETCSATEYCVVTCLCCGIPGGTPESSYECRSFTRSCDASNMCACPEIAELGGICDQEALRVDIPCA